MSDTNELATFMVQGKIANIASSEFKNEDTGELVTTRTIQFKTKLKNGKLDWIDVKIPPEVDHNQFAEGDLYAVPILISSYQGQLYYRANPLMTAQKLS